MKLKKWLENWNMTKLKITAPYLEMEWEPKECDMDAAWEMYIELLTRVATQPLAREHGTEKAALGSVYCLFDITRDVMKRHGRDCIEFTKIAVVVLNQIVRPFTGKWHMLAEKGAFEDESLCEAFRSELIDLQKDLCTYTAMLAEMAGVEDLTKLEPEHCPTPTP